MELKKLIVHCNFYSSAAHFQLRLKKLWPLLENMGFESETRQRILPLPGPCASRTMAIIYRYCRILLERNMEFGSATWWRILPLLGPCASRTMAIIYRYCRILLERNMEFGSATWRRILPLPGP